jgi:hypothetical protein
LAPAWIASVLKPGMRSESAMMFSPVVVGWLAGSAGPLIGGD